MSIDVIGDFLTIIRNGIMRSSPHVHVPYSRVKHAFAVLLQEEGFLRSVEVTTSEGDLKTLKITLRYVAGESAIHDITRISTPGSRVYQAIKHVKPVAGGFGVAILSTNKGIMTNKKARELGVGGEVLCTVW